MLLALRGAEPVSARLVRGFPRDRRAGDRAADFVLSEPADGSPQGAGCGDCARGWHQHQSCAGSTTSSIACPKAKRASWPKRRASARWSRGSPRRSAALDSVDRPFLREPYAEALVSKIEAFRGQISGFHEPLASEFRKAADAWLKRAQAQLEQIKKITGREPTPQVFRAGDPVDRSQEAFVPRHGRDRPSRASGYLGQRLSQSPDLRPPPHGQIDPDPQPRRLRARYRPHRQRLDAEPERFSPPRPISSA